MIKLIVVLIISISGFLMASEKRTLTESEITKMINEEVLKKMERINEKNIIGFSRNLLHKEEELNDFETRLKRKEEKLKINQKELSEKIGQFIDKQKKFIGCIDNVEKNKRKRVGHLVEIIAGMKPKMAGNVLSVQDSDIAVEILSELPAVKMSKIFNSMDKEISARLQKQYMNMKK